MIRFIFSLLIFSSSLHASRKVWSAIPRSCGIGITLTNLSAFKQTIKIRARGFGFNTFSYDMGEPAESRSFIPVGITPGYAGGASTSKQIESTSKIETFAASEVKHISLQLSYPNTILADIESGSLIEFEVSEKEGAVSASLSAGGCYDVGLLFYPVNGGRPF